MLERQSEHGSLFWAGFAAGAAVGGALGVLFASEIGKRALAHVEMTAKDLQGRFNGSARRPEETTDTQAEAPVADASPGAAEEAP
jgi:hypothetical protein